MTSMSHHAAPTGRRVSSPPPSSASAPPTERSGHGAGSAVQRSHCCSSEYSSTVHAVNVMWVPDLGLALRVCP
eukprot:2569826-Prymnesium_polylepis.1